jgi:hypothetical protein
MPTAFNAPDGDSSAKPGWYPDPIGAGEFRYWNGAEWTNDTYARRSVDGGGMTIGVGGIVLAVSPFLPWAKVLLLGNLSLFQLLELDGHGRALAWILVIVGAGTAFNVWVSKIAVQGLAIVAGILLAILTVLLAIRLHHDARELQGAAAVSYGSWVAAAACVAMVIGGFLSQGKPSGGHVPPPPD